MNQKKLSAEMLAILACPLCKGDLVYDEKNQELICYDSELAFKIIDGVPVMLVDEARSLKPLSPHPAQDCQAEMAQKKL